MTQFVGRVRIMPRAGLLDPQGHAIEHALGALGFAQVRTVHVGRTIEVTIDAPSTGVARDVLRGMCERLLANPVTEDFTVDAVETVA